MKTKQYVKRVLLTLLMIILSFAVLSFLASFIFCAAAFPRADDPLPAVGRSSVNTEAYPHETIRFPSGANMLTGTLYHAEKPQALMVIAAGFRESGASYTGAIRAFLDSGYSVFCYDATGVGKSDGDGTGGLSQPALDLNAALAYAADNDALSRLPVLLYGHSAGGYATATCLDQPQVKAAVILSGFESPTCLMRETARGYVGVLADIEYPFLKAAHTITCSAKADQSASDCIRDASVPVAVYEGENDAVIPASVRLSRRLKDDDPNVRLTVIAGGTHHDLWKTVEEAALPSQTVSVYQEIIRDVLAFYRQALY